MTTQELAQAVLNTPDFYERQYTLQDLFKIRDSLIILKQYDLEDKKLLKQVEEFIKQKGIVN